MKRKDFSKIVDYVHTIMTDGAHDSQHVNRVLYCALDIANTYKIDTDVIIAAALLQAMPGNDSQHILPYERQQTTCRKRHAKNSLID